MDKTTTESRLAIISQIGLLLRHPATFFKSIESVKPDWMVSLLLMLGGIAQSMTRAMEENRGDKSDLSSVLMFSVLFGALLGWFTFYVYAAALSWSSEYLGGKASRSLMVKTVAYSLVPIIFWLPIYAIEIGLHGNAVFQKAYDETIQSEWLPKMLLWIRALLLLYSILLLITGIRQAQHFSLSKAVLNALFPLLLVGVLAAIFLVVLMLVGTTLG